MPEVTSKNQRTVIYSLEELKQLVHEDLMKRGMSKATDQIIDMSDTQKKTGDLPRGVFDSDPIYSFSGLSIVVQE